MNVELALGAVGESARPHQTGKPTPDSNRGSLHYELDAGRDDAQQHVPRNAAFADAC